MTIKDILLVTDDSEAAVARTTFALALADAFGAHLTGVALAPVIPVAAPAMSGMVAADIYAAEEARAKERAEAAASAFEAAAGKAGGSYETRVIAGIEGATLSDLAVQARHSDLVLVGQPSQDADPLGPGHAAIERLMFDSGRPILMVPIIGAPPTLPKKPMVAWNGSREAARALHDALPLLVKAGKAELVVVDGEKRPSAHGMEPGADMGAHLARHGLKIDVKRISTGGIGVGDRILSHAADMNTDLIVLGAYGHSRLRELILGGVTRTILSSMTVPVLMSH